MQVNKTQFLTYLLTLPTAFTVQSIVLSLTRPDGVQVTDITGSLSPGTNVSAGTIFDPTNTPGDNPTPVIAGSSNFVSATSQTLYALFTPIMGGKWTGIWKVTIGGQVYTYPIRFWVVWTDIYDAVRAMLGSTSVNLADSILDKEFQNLDTELRDYTSSALPLYYSFNSVYQEGYDQGMSKLLAARIRPYVAGKMPTGEITLFKKGTTTVQYSLGTPRAEKTLETQWIEQGMAILEANIQEIYLVAVQDRTGDEVMSRGDAAIGNRHPYGNWDTDTYGYFGVDINGYI